MRLLTALALVAALTLPAQVISTSGGVVTGIPVAIGDIDACKVTGNLVSEWRHDEGVGETLGDSVGTNDGELGCAVGATNDPDWITEGLDYVGANSDRVCVPFFFDPSSGAFSAMFLVNFTQADAGNVNVISQENGAGTGRSWITFDGTDALCTLLGGSAQCRAGGAVADGWHTVTVTYDGASTVRLYLDGGADETTFAATTPESATGQHRFGISKTSTSPYNDKMSWAWFYNDQLTSGEVTTNHDCLKNNIGRGITLP